MSKMRKIGRGLFGVAVLGSLLAGASSLLAEPARAALRGCNFKACYENCLAAGFSGGSCNYMDDSCDCTY